MCVPAPSAGKESAFGFAGAVYPQRSRRALFAPRSHAPRESFWPRPRGRPAIPLHTRPPRLASPSHQSLRSPPRSHPDGTASLAPRTPRRPPDSPAKSPAGIFQPAAAAPATSASCSCPHVRYRTPPVRPRNMKLQESPAPVSSFADRTRSLSHFAQSTAAVHPPPRHSTRSHALAILHSALQTPAAARPRKRRRQSQRRPKPRWRGQFALCRVPHSSRCSRRVRVFRTAAELALLLGNPLPAARLAR